MAGVRIEWMKRKTALLIIMALPILAFGVYVIGYFAVSEESTAYKFEDTIRIRYFQSKRMEWAYGPAVKTEAFLTGWDVTSRQANRPQPHANQ